MNEIARLIEPSHFRSKRSAAALILAQQCPARGGHTKPEDSPVGFALVETLLMRPVECVTVVKVITSTSRFPYSLHAGHHRTIQRSCAESKHGIEPSRTRIYRARRNRTPQVPSPSFHR